MKESLNYHPIFPALPEQATDITPDASCANCSLAQAVGHETCSTFKLKNDPAIQPENRINLKQNRELQYAIHRRQFDADGIVGSDNGRNKDGAYFHNAVKQINFTYFSSWRVVSVDGSTITLAVENPSTDNAKSTVHSTWSERDCITGMYNITGFVDYTAISPNDMLQFQYPSKACDLNAKVIRVIDSSEAIIELELDKNLEFGTSFYPLKDEFGDPIPDPDHPIVKVYHYGKESEDWFFQSEPHYFFGRFTQKVIEVGAPDFPADGIWEIEDDVVAPPESFDTLTPNFVLEGQTIEGWQVINENSRLHIKPGHSCIALKTTLPSGSQRDEPGTDLTETYSRFRASYFKKTGTDDPLCRIVGYDRCYHSRIDHSKSAGNYNALHGAGITDNGTHVYCHQRVYSDFEYIDDTNRFTSPPSPGTDGIPDRVTTTAKHPTGLKLFPNDSGQCIAYGYCNKFTSAITRQLDTSIPRESKPCDNTVIHYSERGAPWNVDNSMRFLTELWFASNAVIRQKYIMAPWPVGFSIETVSHPSIMWQKGWYNGITTQGGYRPMIFPRNHGTWNTRKPRVIIDQNGNQILHNPGGLEVGHTYEWDAVEEEYVVDDEFVGEIPAVVPDFTIKRNPFNPNLTQEQNLLEYIGATVQRDDLTIEKYRGLSGFSVALNSENIIAPNFVLTNHALQQSTRTTFHWPSPSSDATIKILPYRQENKSERVIGDREIHYVQPLGDHRYLIQFRNTPKRYSELRNNGFGDSYNHIYTVDAGGGPCILPYENQRLSSYEGDKETGSRNAGAVPLDCVEISDHRFVIESVLPHGGTQAATWGNRQITINREIGGYFTTLVEDDADGNLLLPVSNLVVKRISDNVEFDILTNEDRPELAADECWYDGANRIYFSSANHADYLQITYDDSIGDPYTQYHTINEVYEFETATDYDEWTNATGKTVYANHEILIPVGGTPQKGECRVSNASGNIKLEFNIDDAPTEWRVVLTFDEDADTPQDFWSVNNKYTQFGRLQDAVIVRADGNFLGSDFFIENNVTGETATFYSQATVYLPKPSYHLQFTIQGNDNWITIHPEFYTMNAASGTITLHADFFPAYLTPVGGIYFHTLCFKINDIQMVDHRGSVPASIINKTESVIDNMTWLQTSPRSGSGAQYKHGYEAQKLWWFETPIDDPCGQYRVDDPLHEFPPFFPTSNYVDLQGQREHGGQQWASHVYIAISSSGFGLPDAFCNLPDDVEIREAWATITTSGLTRERIWGHDAQTDCDDNVIDPGSYHTTTLIEDIKYAVLGFTSEESYDVIGYIENATNGTRAVDVTEIMQKIYESRKEYHYGFATVIVPNQITSGTSIMPDEGPTRTVTRCPGMPCEGTSIEEYFTHDSTYIKWSNCLIENIWIDIDYKGKDKLDTIQPRLPSFIDLPED